MPRIFSAFALIALIAGESAAQTRPASAPVRPVWPDEGPTTWTPRPTTAAITANDLRTRLYAFAHDSMMGRRIGELGNTKGTDYIAREFKRLGLKPAGEDGTYFQTLPWGPVSFDSASSRLSAGGVALAPTTEWVPTAPNANSGIGGAAAFSAVPTVFAGYWGDTAAMIDPAMLRGKIAVFVAAPAAPAANAGGGAGRGAQSLPRCDSVPDRFGAAAAVIADAAAAAARGNTAGRGAAAGTAGGGRGGRGGGAGGRGAAGGVGARDPRAQGAGAAAILVVGLESLTAQQIRTAFSGNMGMRPANTNAAAGIPAATISAAAAARIFGKNVDDLTVGAAGQPVSGEWSYQWRPGPHPARNVIAILPGSDPARASEYVLVGAHNDHIGTTATSVDHDSLRAVNSVTRRQGANDPACRPTEAQQRRIDSLIARARSIRPVRRDSINNGADDDGSGTVVMLEIAEQFAREKPARSIIFISHQGEEGGLRGSAWFVDNPTVPLEKIVAAHNMDMVGKGRVDQVKFGGPTSVQTLGSRRLSREFGDIIDSVNATRAEVMAIDKTWEVPSNPMNRFCRSDQVNYVRKDIPVTYFSLGYAADYHQLTDEPQYIDYEHSAKLGRFVHDIMTAIANRKDKPAISGADPTMPSCR